MLVAKIAEIDLLQKNPGAFYLAQNITSLLNAFSHGKIRTFTESATWSDDVKKFNLGILDPWHYINIPVRLNGDPTPRIPRTKFDCLEFLQSAMKVLTTWKKEELDNINNTFEKSMMLRYLIHVVGDVHQPLHSINFFDDFLFPNGDFGGNLFLIDYSSQINNLHKFFDSGADSLPNNLERPLSIDSVNILNKMAISFIKEFPNINQVVDFETWVVESYQISREFIYKNVTYKSQLTQKYKDASFFIVRQRIVQAGHRLAHLIEAIYESYSKARSSRFLG